MDGVSGKSRAATAVLAFFLGTLGIHRFYIGKIGTALTMLLLGIVGWVMLIAGAVTAAVSLGLGGWGVAIVGYILIGVVELWAFIDFILALVGALKDKQGDKVTKW